MARTIRRPFGRTGVQVPIVGQGTWRLRDPAAAARALALGLDLGMTHIDTAELYETNSRSETVLAGVLRERERDDVFLASKVWPTNATYEGTIRACEASLRRLAATHLDLYYLHWESRAAPLADTMRAMRELVRRGLVRHVGVSNFDVARMEEARAALDDVPLAANQVLYHLGERSVEHDVLPHCREHGIALVAYSPLGATGRLPGPGDGAGGRALADVAARHAATPHQVALAFLANDPAVFTIPKAEREEHVRANAAAGDLALAADDVAELDRAFPRPRAGRGLATA